VGGGAFFSPRLFTNQVYFFYLDAILSPKSVDVVSLRQPCVIFATKKTNKQIFVLSFFVVDLPTHFNKFCSASSFAFKIMGWFEEEKKMRNQKKWLE
jgi:hypothetical protein